MTAEALEYQRSCQDQTNAQDLLQHIFEACKQSKYWVRVDVMYMHSYIVKIVEDSRKKFNIEIL